MRAPWLREILVILKVEKIWRFLGRVRGVWEINLRLSCEIGIMEILNVKLKRRTFQRDSISPILLVLVLNPFIKLKNREKERIYYFFYCYTHKKNIHKLAVSDSLNTHQNKFFWVGKVSTLLINKDRDILCEISQI